MNYSVPNYGIKKIGNSPAISLPTLPIGCVLGLSGLPGGGAQIYDRSPYGNIGTITGAVWKVLPSGLWYLDFDGSDDLVDCGSASGLDITVGVTIEAWLNRATVGTSAYHIIATKGTTFGSVNYGLAIRDLEAGNDRIVSGNAAAEVVFGDWVANTWYHIAVAYNSAGNGFAYLNGISRGAISGESLTTNASAFTVASFAGGGNYFSGGIALVRVYNRVLSALELQNHYQQEKHLFGVW